MNGMPRVRSASLTDHPVCPRRVRVRPPCDGGCACRHKRLRIGAVVPDPTTQQHARSPQPLTVKCTGIYLIVFAPVCRVCRAAVLMEQHMCPAQAPIRKMHGHLRSPGGVLHEPTMPAAQKPRSSRDHSSENTVQDARLGDGKNGL